MAKPTSTLTFVWHEQDPGFFLAPTGSIVAGAEIPLNYAVVTTSPFVGSYIEMPGLGPTGTVTAFSPQVTRTSFMHRFNVRTVVLTTVGFPASNITLTGLSINGEVLTEVIAVTGSNTYQSVNYYVALTSVVSSASSTSGQTLAVGIGNAGYLRWFIADVWSKNAQYSMSYTNISGTVSLTPSYSMNIYSDENNSIFDATSTGLYTTAFALPISNTNIFAVSPASTTLPLTTTADVMISFSLPLQGLTTAVTATTGSFVQTIMQQGGTV